MSLGSRRRRLNAGFQKERPVLAFPDTERPNSSSAARLASASCLGPREFAAAARHRWEKKETQWQLDAIYEESKLTGATTAEQEGHLPELVAKASAVAAQRDLSCATPLAGIAEDGVQAYSAAVMPAARRFHRPRIAARLPKLRAAMPDESLEQRMIRDPRLKDWFDVTTRSQLCKWGHCSNNRAGEFAKLTPPVRLKEESAMYRMRNVKPVKESASGLCAAAPDEASRWSIAYLRWLYGRRAVEAPLVLAVEEDTASACESSAVEEPPLAPAFASWLSDTATRPQVQVFRGAVRRGDHALKAAVLPQAALRKRVALVDHSEGTVYQSAAFRQRGPCAPLVHVQS